MFDITCLDSYGEVITNLTQWDVNQSLTIKNTGLTSAPLFHFCNKNSKEALVVKSTLKDDVVTVQVPNILLQEGIPIMVYLYAYSSLTSGKTLATAKIPVRPRPRPSDYEYVENIDVVSLALIEEEINEAIQTIEDFKINIDTRVSSMEMKVVNIDSKIGLIDLSSGTDLDTVVEPGIYSVYEEFPETAISLHYPRNSMGQLWDTGVMIVADKGAPEGCIQMFIYSYAGAKDGIAIRTIDRNDSVVHHIGEWLFLNEGFSTTATGGFAAGRNAKVASAEGTAIEYMYIGQWKDGKKLSYVSGDPEGLYDKNNTTPPVNSAAQIFNVFDLGKETDISAITLYVADGGASLTNMVCLTNDLSGGRSGYIDVLRTNGEVQNGVPIIENKISSDGYIKVGYTDGNYIGKYRYVLVYDWSNVCKASELYVETDTAETPIPAIQLGEGTNEEPYTLQVYDHQLLDAEGVIPIERIAGKSITTDKYADKSITTAKIADDAVTPEKASFTNYPIGRERIGVWRGTYDIYRITVQQECTSDAGTVTIPIPGTYMNSNIVPLNIQLTVWAHSATKAYRLDTACDIDDGNTKSLIFNKPAGVSGRLYGYIEYMDTYENV